MALGENSTAEKMLKAGISFEPDNIMPYLRLIDVNLRMGDLVEAESLVRFLIQSATPEAVYLSLLDIKKDPTVNDVDYRELERKVADMVGEMFPCLSIKKEID